MEKQEKIFIAGHRGLVGSAILRNLENQGYSNLLYRASSEMDLRNQQEVLEFFKSEEPEFVFLAAAKVGGIIANNTYPADFIRDNLMIQNNIIDASYKFGVKKLLFLGSTCIYPKFAPQPMKEEYLLTGELEPTNEPYAIAKIAGIKMCQSYNRQYGTKYISVMPTNLYGPYDNFDLETSHVMPALIRKFHEAKENESSFVEVWGTGNPKREFLYVDELADACVFIMNHYEENEIVNIGVGEDISIGDLARLIKDIVGFKGAIRFDSSKPDGTPRKLVDVTKLNKLGWKAETSLEQGIKQAYKWFMDNQL
ncbi:GDP-L-fucose synthase [Paenibacillus sp. LjRoot153]|uniref:GDP-L-fucose synthase n=1 Tax=Paenibacillus sp. LjRoot153 TaxID=3342270 RepID=UPI003ED03D06